MERVLRSQADLAARLQKPLSTVNELRKRERWPHIRIGRSVRFTEEQIEHIIASHTTVDAPKDPPVLGGQTPRSARRSA